MTRYAYWDCNWGYAKRDDYKYCAKRLSSMPYAQAGVSIYSDHVTLVSYSTAVCTIDSEGWLTCSGTYSQTTRKHIGAFMREYGNGASYYTAKACYENDHAYNIYTGEIIPVDDLAKRIEDEAKQKEQTVAD